jgi:hypothetical protein
MLKPPSILGKIILLVQVSTLWLMQGYVLTPSSSFGIFNRTEGVNRIRYHRCGCPPEKVAARTCCCYTGKCSSSSPNSVPACHSCSPKPPPTLNFISVGGCMEEYYGSSSGKAKFIGTSSLLHLYRRQTLFLQFNQISPKQFFSAPLVPPPKIANPFLTA